MTNPNSDNKASSASKPATKPVTKARAATRSYKSELDRMTMLLNISKEVAAADNLDGMLRTIVDLVVKETGSERGSVFLYDKQTGELYSRYAKGSFKREIRILSNKGVAGHVFTNGEGLIIHDAYSDERFDSSVDKETGFVTKCILCAPIYNVRREVIGVVQALNKASSRYNEKDLHFLESMSTQVAITLESAQHIELMEQTRKQEMKFLDMVSDITSEIEIDTLLQKVISEATRMLKADRGTLFLNDEKSKELFSRVAMGDSIGEIRLPNTVGIAGAVFASKETINIPYAYADLRFNPAFDKKTGYFTRSILCVPVINKKGVTIGVTQMLNKKGGVFTQEDESRLKAFTAQVSIALENAKLFEDIQRIKNYNESMLESMSNGVITISDEGEIVTCNKSGLHILQVTADEMLHKPAKEFFVDENEWILERVDHMSETLEMDIMMDVEILCGEAQEKVSVNLSFLPLMSGDNQRLGSMIMIEDISSEKRVKSTMARYMDAGIADQLMAGGDDLLGGKSIEATVLFSDIRSFTTLTESLGAQGTVQLLNEYFTIMVDVIQDEGGMLDKFIGDAMMAGFGLPVAHGDDTDRALRAAILMIVKLNEFNEARAKEGKMEVKMGIGLNTDMVVAGNIGSPKRMDYTMIGDGVNLAARLESACKTYFSQILISEYTYRKLKGTYRMREIDLVIVKGKTKPVGIYEVLDYHTEETFPNLMDTVNHFSAGLQRYRKGFFQTALESFEEALAHNPSDKLSAMYIERCQHLIEEPPPEEEWDGIWVMKTK
ncbi:MAG: GAF domain-containing protein [Magnetococcales bacterium]|nr:GAF domain-containing protein [Magnetococcales bacterium]